MTNHALVLTGEVLPGFTPLSVWPQLAGYLRMEPEKLTQLLARAPLIIKSGDDSAPLQALQAGIARLGGAARLYPPDERPDLFVALDGTTRGPIPRAMADQQVRQGVWPDWVQVTATGSTDWRPYREIDALIDTAPPPAVIARAPASAPQADVLAGGVMIHAGFWRRYAAAVLDGLIVITPLAVICCLAWFADNGFQQAPEDWLLGLLLLCVYLLSPLCNWLYHAWMESSGWQATLGKRVLGIKVVDKFGRRIGFGRATGRNFGKIVSGVTMYIGHMMAGWTERKQALHDMMADTFVVFNAVQPDQPPPAQRPPMPWHGWALIALFPVIYLVAVVVGVGYGMYEERTYQEKVNAAIAATLPLQAEIARQGCQSGERPSPGGWIDTVEVIASEKSKPCTIELTLGESADIPTALRGQEIDLTRGGDGRWTCSSTALNKYLPESCRTQP